MRCSTVAAGMLAFAAGAALCHERSGKGIGVAAAAALAAVAFAPAATAAPAGQPGPIIIDCDIGAGYDDCVLVMMAANSTDVELVGITIAGQHNELRSRVARRILWLAGRPEVPVCLGLAPPNPHDDLSALAGWGEPFTGLPPATEPAPRFLVDQVLRQPGRIAILITGPATNFAAALELAKREGKRDEFVRGVRYVAFTGGSPDEGTRTIELDPAAARALLSSGVVVYMLGAGAKRPYLTYEERARYWAMPTPLVRALQELYMLYGQGLDPNAPYIPNLDDACALALSLPGAPVQLMPCRIALRRDGRVRIDSRKRGHYWRTAQDVSAICSQALARVTMSWMTADRHLLLAEQAAPSPLPAPARQAVDDARQLLHEDVLPAEALPQAFDALDAVWQPGEAVAEHLRLARAFALACAPAVADFADTQRAQPRPREAQPPPPRLRKRHVVAALLVLAALAGAAAYARRARMRR